MNQISSKSIMLNLVGCKESLKALHHKLVQRQKKRMGPQYQDELESILSDIEVVVEQISKEIYRPR